ncbi:ROK family protein [Microbacterium sp. NPDC090007]|uniref:ROK family protein n=1 Tax=Microbacterium sp. NPDC090007 TaxID=3364204 RepID=UPI003819A801
MLSESEAAVAREILMHGPLSRRALAARLHLSPASLTRLTRPLLAAGLVVERADDAPGTVGRPSRPLDVSPTAGVFIGVKLTGDRMYLVATDIRAQILTCLDRPLHDTSAPAVVAAIADAVAGLGFDEVRAVGVTLGGHVDRGVAVDAPFLGWRDEPVSAAIEARLGIPVTLENDVVALTDAERWFGRGRGIPGFVVLTIGAGVGMGLVVEGRTVRTPDAGAGTVGHLPLRIDGPTCPRGHRGCADALLTSGALVTRVSRSLGRAVDLDEVFARAAASDPVARAVVDDAADALGTLCALAANLSLHADIVLAGEAAAVYDLAPDRVGATLARGRAEGLAPVTVHLDDGGFAGWARGAAAVAIQAGMDRIRRTH